jgi:hypothetical protein
MSITKIGLYFLAAITFGSCASAGPMRCFSVSQMFESEDHRYFVDAMSHCGKEIEVVYVRVAFLNELGRELTRSFWSLRLVRPERRERHEFAYPRSAEGFARIKLLEVVTTLEEAMR